MVVGEGLFVAGRLTLRAALKRVVSLRETRTLSKLLILPERSDIGIYRFDLIQGSIQGWWWGKDSNLRSL